MFFQSEVHLLSFEESSSGHWAQENALNLCFHHCAKWKGAMTFCCPWDFLAFSIILHPLENSVPF
jgi:hypothetical protein